MMTAQFFHCSFSIALFTLFSAFGYEAHQVEPCSVETAKKAPQTSKVQPSPAIAEKPVPGTSERAAIETLIRDLADTQDLPGEGFAAVPWARRMMFGMLMLSEPKDNEAFTRLVEIGPPALPHLLKALDDKTPTKMTVRHGGDGFITIGGMWYGHRPAVRWAADEIQQIQALVKWKFDDERIVKSTGLPEQFVAAAKTGTFPNYVPQSKREFNPRNPAEKKLIEAARGELLKQKKPPGDAKVEVTIGVPDSLASYPVTVGDVCYEIVGQITNRTYEAVQYQPTSCLYIHSPTHDPRIARDVRAVWKSNDSARMLLASLKADFELEIAQDGYRIGAVLRLGYYFPEESERFLLDLLSQITSPSKKDPSRVQIYFPGQLLKAIAASKSKAVQKRVLDTFRTTKEVDYFLALSEVYGKAHNPLVLRRANEFIKVLPQDDIDHVKQVLQMLDERFPVEAKKLFKAFVESKSVHRRVTAIEALWDSPSAPEILAPLLDDTRSLGRFPNGERICDLARQVIRQNQ